MHIGDRVRLLHSKEEGVIVSIGSSFIEVEIEDGFSIPVARSEIVLISSEENRLKPKEANSTQKATSSQESKVFSVKGIFVGILPINDQKVSLHLINNTDWDLPFTITHRKGDVFQGVTAGMLASKTQQKIEDAGLTNFEQWDSYVFQFLFARKGNFELQEPLLKTLRFRAHHFKSQQKLPVLDKNGYLVQLDKDESSPRIDPDQLKEKMFEKNTPEIPVSKDIVINQQLTLEVDLHIEKLHPHPETLSSPEILEIQLKTFERHLDAAIAKGLDKIIFIHGVGGGTLRNEIHRRAGKNPHIAYFQDAQKSKFGYGATLLVIK